MIMINSEELFYYADKESAEFIKLPKEKFEEKFASYEEDLQEGIATWKLGENTAKEEKEDEEKEGEERWIL